MDVSIIDEMPPGRHPVRTILLPSPRWPEAFDAARSELAEDRNVFVIYPLVEENHDLDLTSAKEGFRTLSTDVFPDYKCCLLHGQMSQLHKQEAMEGFRSGRYQVMAATTVVEVGIDVPQASTMVIQHAERLGLAQLHQLRGRIARGAHASTCYLLADPTTPEASRRLQVMVESNDGFRIAEEDLRIRGPGELFGTEQSGMPGFRFYDFSDTEVLRAAHADARDLVAADPDLSEEAHVALRESTIRDYGDKLALVDVG
jgi:ATP-dependent DNA helicase RecG